MNILYKYCNQSGGIKTLELLELKLPYITEVNDPLECRPLLACNGDVHVLETRIRSSFQRQNISPPSNLREYLNEQINTGGIAKRLKESCKELKKRWDEHQACLLCASGTPRNTLMWAHYAEKHKGIVIGIDFDRILLEPNKGIEMDSVIYSKQRPKIDIGYDPYDDNWRLYSDVLRTKSMDWYYEQEFRSVIIDSDLQKMQQQGLAEFKDYNKRKSWFLKINPLAIRDIIFGLYAEESIKLKIREIKNCVGLKHIKLFNVIESDSYDFQLVEEDL